MESYRDEIGLTVYCPARNFWGLGMKIELGAQDFSVVMAALQDASEWKETEAAGCVDTFRKSHLEAVSKDLRRIHGLFKAAAREVIECQK